MLAVNADVTLALTQAARNFIPTTMPPLDERTRRIQVLLLSICVYAANYMFLAVYHYSSTYYWKQHYHISALSDHAWVQELIHGHPDCIYNGLGMRLHVFLAFTAELRTCGLKDTRYTTVEEQAAIFLYMCVTGLKIRHVGERFQRANATISKYVFL